MGNVGQNRFLFVAALIALAVPTAYAQTVYWTDVGTGKIQRADLVGGTGVEDLVTTQVIEPVGLALDLVAGKMYWTEASPADFMISRANLDGTNVELLVTDLVSPSGIAVDVAGGKMYWTDVGTISDWGSIKGGWHGVTPRFTCYGGEKV